VACPTNPPPPTGYRVWRGPVPQPLVDWAISLRDQIATFEYGTTFELPYGGIVAVARKDHHTWTYRAGKLVTGLCLPGITLYSPSSPAVGAGAVDDTSTPDPNAALFTADAGIDWKLVAVSGLATAAVIGAFFLALHHAGQTKRPRGRPTRRPWAFRP
jgi:hypothetical protein